MWDPYSEFQVATLPNGLTIHAAYWPGRSWEAMGFLIHSGAEHDPVGLEGLSHFVEHVVSENTNLSKKKIISFFEDCGGTVHLGSTGYPCTQYQFFAPADKAVLVRAFSIFGNMLLLTNLRNFIEQERQVIIREFYSYYPLKCRIDLSIRKNKALYAGYWLERFIRPLGNPESVSQITQSDLQSYYDAHYTPANISIVGVGGMKLEQLIELLSESPFAIHKKGERTPLPVPVTNVTPPSETRYVFEISKHFTMPIEVGSYTTVAKIPGNIKGSVICIINYMFDKVILENVREKHAWAYDIDVNRQNFRHFYEFSIHCDALAPNAINDIEKVIEICIDSIIDREDLFEQVKRRILASNSMIDFNGNNVLNDAIEDLAQKQRIISLKEISDDIEHITMNDIRDVLQWLQPERRWTLIVKP